MNGKLERIISSSHPEPFNFKLFRVFTDDAKWKNVKWDHCSGDNFDVELMAWGSWWLFHTNKNVHLRKGNIFACVLIETMHTAKWILRKLFMWIHFNTKHLVWMRSVYGLPYVFIEKFVVFISMISVTAIFIEVEGPLWKDTISTKFYYIRNTLEISLDFNQIDQINNAV